MAAALVNTELRPERVPPPPGPEVTRFHRELPGYAPTPLRPLPAVAAALGLGTVAMKDESDRFGLPAFKILGASWAVARALRHDPAVRLLVAASAGNHGRAVARCAARHGLACRIYLPAGSSRDRVAAIAAEGAEVIAADGGYDQAVAAAARAGGEPGATLVADDAHRPDARSPAWVVDGYTTLFRELAVQTAEPPAGPAVGPDLLLVPVGVGSLAAAAVRWACHRPGQPAPRVVGVEPTGAACVTASLRAGEPVTVATTGTTLAGLDCATPSAVAWPTLRDGLAGTVVVDDAEAHAAMRELAAAGLAIGDCGAATLAALRRLATDDRCGPLRTAIALGAGTRVVCLGTEGVTDPVAYRTIVR